MDSPSSAPTTEAEVIAHKTWLWQQQYWADRHLAHSGVRPRAPFAPIFARIAALLRPGSRVLDVGCGHGRLSIPLAEAGHTVVAVDVSERMLELLRQHRGSLPIEIRPGDAHRLPAADAEFDAVISYDFMPHFPDWRSLLVEQARVCKPGGHILFAFNFTEHREMANEWVGDDFEHSHSPDVTPAKPYGAECSMDQMKMAGEAAGLTLLQAIPIRFVADSHLFGAALGTREFERFHDELVKRLEGDPAIAEFYRWLDLTLFQRLPFFAAYRALLAFERNGASSIPAPGLRSPRRPAAAIARERDAFLDEIPSELSLPQRKYLYEHFRHQWDGVGDAAELGAALGAATRAMALGMCERPLRCLGSRLHLIDTPETEPPPDRLRSLMRSCVASGILAQADADSLGASGDCRMLFERLHRRQPYFRCLRRHGPDRGEKADPADACADLGGPETQLSAVYVGGGSTWADLRRTMCQLLPRLRPGGAVIFQDYGSHACFWITAFVHAVRPHLALAGSIEAMYHFRLEAPLSADEVSRRFAPAPEEMGAGFFKQVCVEGMKSGVQRKDVRAALVAQLHWIAALATLGRKAEAAAALRTLEAANFGPFGGLIEQSRQSPGRLPGNRPILWSEA